MYMSMYIYIDLEGNTSPSASRRASADCSHLSHFSGFVEEGKRVENLESSRHWLGCILGSGEYVHVFLRKYYMSLCMMPARNISCG